MADEPLSTGATVKRSINFDEYQYQLRKRGALPFWWVVMLVNIADGNQTRFMKTVKPPNEFRKTLPLYENNKIWNGGIYVCVSTDPEEAENFIKLVCGELPMNGVTKQIRGIISRAATCDQVAWHFRYPAYACFDVILSEPDTDWKIVKKLPASVH